MSATFFAGILQCCLPVSITRVSMANMKYSLDYAARLSTVGSQANYAQSAACRICCLHDRIVGSFCQDDFDLCENTR